jgi:putative membrane protein
MGNLTAVRLVLSWLTNVLAIYVASLVFDGIFYGSEAWVLFVAGLVFGLVNALVRPIVILLTLPAVILTLGLALFLINALMLWLTDLIIPPFEAQGFWTLLGGAVLIWAVNMVVHGLVRRELSVHRATA